MDAWIEGRPVPGLVRARFTRRPNRFVVDAELENGENEQVHLADPGRLVELLVPGAELRLRRASPAARRATAYTAALVRDPSAPRVWVGLETARANGFAGTLLRAGRIPGLPSPGPRELRREVGCGPSRIDYCLERPRRLRHWIEIKSVTLARQGRALFPDAPTERGRRHVVELTERVRGGERATLIFVAQRGDVRSISPHTSVDPAFAAALTEASSAGVRLLGVRIAMHGDGRARYDGPVPVVLHGTQAPACGR